MTPTAEPNGEDSAGPALSFRRVRKSYGHIEALKEVDLEVRAGEIHALLGDNGAGKSTLMKLAAGVAQPDSGTISVNGEAVVLDSPFRARQLGIETVYQDLALADDRSSAANVFVGREVRRRGLAGRLGFLDRKAMTTRTRDEFTELSIPVRDVRAPVRVLSGGQRQGVAIARAAIWTRHVLLLDEPTAALGVRQRAVVSELIAGLRQRKLAILLISHDVPEVLKIADRITVLRLGEKVATRRASEVDLNWAVKAMVGGGVS